MGYSTDRNRDHGRMLLGILSAAVALALAFSLLPFGISSELVIWNDAGIDRAQLARILEKIDTSRHLPSASEIHKKTLLCPWERMQYRNSIRVENAPRAVDVTLIATKPDGDRSVRYRARQRDGKWEVRRFDTVLAHY